MALDSPDTNPARPERLRALGGAGGAPPGVSGFCHIFPPLAGSKLSALGPGLGWGCAFPSTDVAQLEFSADAWEKSDRK